jgi:hypothetical protein
VIKFKCIYCGQRILAKDDGAGKKGKCPKCAHLLTVPESTKGRPAISFDKEPMSYPAPSHDYDPWPHDQGLVQLCKESFGFLIPAYDKLSILLMAISFILALSSKSFIHIFTSDFVKLSKTEMMIFLSSLFMFIIFPILILFRSLVLTEADLKKQFMLFFAVLINAYSGITAGIYIIGNNTNSYWMLIFPVWNVINSLLLLPLFYANIIDEDCISDRQATPKRIIFGLISIISIFLLCNYVFKLYWAITFSICIIYTTSFDKGLQSVFPGWTGPNDEQSEV